MNKTQIILILLSILSCNKEVNHVLDENTQIKVKYQTLDETISPNHSKCSDEIRDFKKMGKYDCSFQIENFEFDIEKKYILNKNGNIKEYWIFKSEGPLIYNIKELKLDPKFLKSIGGNELNIGLLKNGHQILDGGDTLTIEKIFLEEKLILMKKKRDTKKNKRRILSEYK